MTLQNYSFLSNLPKINLGIFIGVNCCKLERCVICDLGNSTGMLDD